MLLRDLLAARMDGIQANADLVPSDVSARRLLDGLGVLLRGSTSTPARLAGRFALSTDCVGPELLVSMRSADISRAGFCLAVAAGADNWADTSLRTLAHPGAAVVPALVAAADPATPWSELAIALTAGYETMEIVGRALNDGAPRLSSQLAGFRSAALCGAFGVIGAIGSLSNPSSADFAHNLRTDDRVEAFGIACDLVGGVTRQYRGPESAIRMQAGSAVRAGFDALALARAGVRSAPDVFEAPGGFLRAHHASPVVAAPVEVQWHIREAAQKFHCAPHNFATALDLMRSAATAAASTSTSIEVTTPQEHLDLAGTTDEFPSSLAQSALNLRYCCARVLSTGDYLWPEDLAAGLSDPYTRQTFDRIRIRGDDDLGMSLHKDHDLWPAVVTVTGADGRLIQLSADRPFGHVQEAEIEPAARAKFERDAAAGGLADPAGALEELLAAVASDGPVLAVFGSLVDRATR